MADIVIEVQGLGRQFGAKVALDNISLSIPAGKVQGLVGENGILPAGEYLARLDGRLAVNAGFLVGHSALRRLVMGEAAIGEPADAAALRAMADLAEVRWRSGDLEGAADAARAHQASGGEEPMAALIVAEDLARSGRPDEAGTIAAEIAELGPAGEESR